MCARKQICIVQFSWLDEPAWWLNDRASECEAVGRQPFIVVACGAIREQTKREMRLNGGTVNPSAIGMNGMHPSGCWVGYWSALKSHYPIPGERRQKISGSSPSASGLTVFSGIYHSNSFGRNRLSSARVFSLPFYTIDRGKEAYSKNNFHAIIRINALKLQRNHMALRLCVRQLRLIVMVRRYVCVCVCFLFTRNE